MPSESVLARIAEFLQTIWEHPAAAAQFVDSPETALATHGLSESDLQGVDLPSVAGGLAGAGGLSPEGQRVLVQFAQSEPTGGSPVQHIGYVTRAVHHDNPTVQKVFIDKHQEFNVDNSVHINNNGGVINGDITVAQDNDTTIATGNATAFGAGSHDNASAGAGGIAAGGDVAQADHGGVVAQGSGSGSGDSASSGHDDQGHDDQSHGDGKDGDGKDGDGKDGDSGHDGEHKAPDFSFGEGDTQQRDDQQDQHGKHGQDDQHDDGSHDGDADQQHGDGQGGDPGLDPTAAAADPTLVEGHDDQHGFDQHHSGPQMPDDAHDQHHGGDAGDLMHA
jgi:hypothetical protein